MSERTRPRDGFRGVRLVRLVNEQRVLEVILAGSASKAELARATGLSKSTVSAVVDDLERSGVITQDRVAVGSIGRPAVLYAIDPSAGHVVGIDLGGTKLLAAMSDLFGDIVTEIEVPTFRETSSGVLEQITGIVQGLDEAAGGSKGPLRALAIGVPGVFDVAADKIHGAYNLPALAEIPVRAKLEDLLGVPVVVANDVNFAALGEQRSGHARSLDSFVSLSIGTGIGMGIMVEGRLITGRTGAAGEIGHLPIAVDDPFDERHRLTGGPFETFAAGPGLTARARRLREDHVGASTLPPEPTTFDVFTAAAGGDAAAVRAVDDEARAIAMAIASVCAVLDPELVVLSGGIGVHPALLEPIRGYVTALLPDAPPVVPSELGSRAALFGAIEAAVRLAREELLSGAGNGSGQRNAAQPAAGLEGGHR